MSDGRDPAIKLFGSTIPLPEELLAADGEEATDSASAAETPIDDEKDYSKEKAEGNVVNAISGSPGELEQKEPECSSSLNAVGKLDHEKSNENCNEADKGKPGQDHKESETSGQDKVLKKPDKILPCPRCNSMDTKFCYYNNYNVNQPRHFCKNCQRYWTAGGTMRNVPVGAGRRKSKHSSSNYRLTVASSDGLASVRVDGPDAIPCGPASSMASKGNGTDLKFGADAPLCQSMASVLNLGEKKKESELKSVACMKEPLCSSSVTASNCTENAIQGYCNGLASFHHLQCFPGLPWVYSWNSGWNNVDGSSSKLLSGQETPIPTPMPLSPSPLFTAPAFCVSPIPFHFFPASFWAATNWNQHWLGGSNNGLSPSSLRSTSSCSGNGSPTLGKHCRDGSLQGEEKMEKSLWVPKTLRIDDPEEAAKSSIFATLGIETDEGGLFQAFKSKVEQREAKDSNQVLKANPAALSRSQSFQETT